MTDYDDDGPLLGSINSGGRHRVEKIKSIALIAVSVLFVTTLALLIWQVTTHKSNNNNNNNNNNTPPQYAWLANDVSSKMDTSVNPCHDFYSYVCGAYEANTVLEPNEQMRIQVFDVIDQNNAGITDWIVNGQWPIIADFMSSCMSPTRQQDAFATTAVLVNATIHQLKSTSPQDLFPVLAQLHLVGSDAFFVPGVMNNIFQDGSANYLQLTMGGLAFGNPAYYVKENLQVLVNATRDVLVGVLNLSVTNALPRAQAAANLEFAIASIWGEPETYQEYLPMMTLAQLSLQTGADYTIYTDALSLSLASSDQVIVSVPSFFQNLTNLIAQSTLQAVHDYLVFHSFLTYEQAIQGGPQLRDSRFQTTTKPHSFVNTNLFGQKKVEDASQQEEECIAAVEYLLEDYMGLLFNLMIVDQNVVTGIQDVTNGVQTAFRNSLPGLTWLDAASRANTATKLSEIVQIIGHPNKLERYNPTTLTLLTLFRYRGVDLDPDHFMDNVYTLYEYTLTDLFSQIGTPFNRSNYEFPATVVNAFYSPFTNTINFPAGILESPMFSTMSPKMLQYARMGYVIGHETTHGFDNNGRMFDGHGVFNDIMDNQTGINFNERASCLVDQYDNFQPYPGVYVNGLQTLGENIADLGGVKNSFRGYKAWVASNGQEFQDHQIVQSLTNDQLFFVLLGQTWCTKATPGAVIWQILNDEHSPSQYRVNGPLSNFDEFANAFNCPASSPMVNQPQCLLW